MTNAFDQELQDRLVRYAAIDSQSDENASGSPSTEIQFDMLNLLVEELQSIGA
ncbi:MAG: peptidase T, partial [Pseudomonadota bacterium]|nr:peptidase T [Pseudomonadota bacterium]